MGNTYDLGADFTVDVSRYNDIEVDKSIFDNVEITKLIAKFIHRYPAFDEIKTDLNITDDNTTIALKMREIILDEFVLYDDYYYDLFIVVLFSLSRIYKSLYIDLKIDCYPSYKAFLKFRNGKIHSVKEYYEESDTDSEDGDAYTYWTLTNEHSYYMREQVLEE